MYWGTPIVFIVNHFIFKSSIKLQLVPLIRNDDIKGLKTNFISKRFKKTPKKVDISPKMDYTKDVNG